MRSDHCWSQGRGRPSASFQAGSWSARQRARFESVTPSASSTMRIDVVLGLRLGEAEAVHLHAVAEAAQLRRRRRRSARASSSSQSSVIARTLQTSSTKRMPAFRKKEMRPERRAGSPRPARRGRARTASSTAIAVRHRVRDLLHRRRAGLLQVVGADVDRVPLRDRVDGVGDHVADQAHRGLGREDVGPAREVLLDDVVLRRAPRACGRRRPGARRPRRRARAATRPSR